MTILVAFALVGPVAFFGWTTLRQQDPAPVPGEDPSPTPAVDAAFVAEIVCASDGTRVLTPVVALQRDGLHVQVGNEAGASILLARDPEHVGTNWGVELQGDSEFVMRHQPGEFVIGCFSGDGYDLREILLSAYTPISVVDPNDYWA